MRKSDERRTLTERKVKRRERLIKNKGLRGGTIYEKHRNKISKSLGYIRDGNVSHYARVGYKRKRSSFVRGKKPIRDQKK